MIYITNEGYSYTVYTALKLLINPSPDFPITFLILMPSLYVKMKNPTS